MQHFTQHIFEHTPASLRETLSQWGMPGFRATQVLKWVYERHVTDPEAMSDLSKADRAVLAERMRFLTGWLERDVVATDGTRKLLVRWEEPAVKADLATARSLPIAGQNADDGGRCLETECVMIPADARRTACISSQVGCPVGCTFCASGLGGAEGNLSTGRIVEQVWRLDAILAAQGERITNVVFMGMGEPLANYNAVVRAVRTLMAPWAFGIGGRRITISTVGLPPGIRRLADEELPVTLALSLHAPDDELRRRLIPWAEYTTIAELLDACRYYFEKTGREITLEYTLLREVNDRPEHARQLAKVARTLRANVNLIRYNEVEGLEFRRPLDEDVLEFQRLLRERHVNAHIRASRGRDIAAACGQLRHEQRTARA